VHAVLVTMNLSDGSRAMGGACFGWTSPAFQAKRSGGGFLLSSTIVPDGEPLPHSIGQRILTDVR
jgi:hypothetical protein